MSSWLDTNFLGSLAKTAIAEAQKKLDKALDIREDDDSPLYEDRHLANDEEPQAIREPPTSSMVKSLSTNLTATGWGSFTGSFFEAAELSKGGEKTHSNRRKSRERKSDMKGLPSSTSEPVSLQPKGHSMQFDLHKPADLKSSFSTDPCSSALMSPAEEDDQLLESLPSVNVDLSLKGVDDEPHEKLFCDNSSESDKIRPDPEGESELSFAQNESDPLVKAKVKEDSEAEYELNTVTTSSIASTSTLLSSVTLLDDPEELNSSLSSSQTMVSGQQTVDDTDSTLKPEDLSQPLEEDCQETVISTNALLEEAMAERSSPNETSPVDQEHHRSSQEDMYYRLRPDSVAGSNSSKSFELLKMPQAKSGNPNGSGSGHTSGDDMETFTTTSSDIEVISSPGYSERSGVAGTGGGSPVSLTKRSKTDQNVTKPTKKGHFRTCSEISSISATSENCDVGEVDRLLKKISELSEVLEVREMKVFELSRTNSELQEQNVDLSSQVKEAMKINAKLAEANISSEEFTQRMAGLEKRLQQLTAERDSLKDENKILKKDRVCSKEVDKQLAEKDEIISDLRAEGENLSKQAGKQSEIIKKLRTKEKILEKDLTSTKSSLDEKTKECDRLKKSLNAKDEVETKQIDAIRELTTANSKWEGTNAKTASDLEDAYEKINGLKVSLESAHKEMGELKRGLLEKDDEAREAQLQKEIEARERLERQAREDQETFRQQRDTLCREIDELRVALSAEERTAARREEEMRRERLELQQRLEQSEHRHEELSGSVSLATRPLLRQIESLQASLSETRTNCDRVEMSLTERLQQTSIQLAASQERERTAADQYRQMSSKAASLESQIQSLLKAKADIESRLEAETHKLSSLEEKRSKEAVASAAAKLLYEQELLKLKSGMELLESSLETEKSNLIAEQRKNVALAQQLKDRDKRIKDIQVETDMTRYSEKSSPTPSLSQLSIGGSLSENPWPEEVFDPYGVSGRASIAMTGGIYESGRAAGGSMAALLESFQAQLKQREGEIIQLQMEIRAMELAKEDMAKEIGRLTRQADELHQLQDEMKDLKALYVETEQKYQTMLTMYGEKMEEAEELRLDLLDVKELYKTQIVEVLKSSNIG